MTRCRPGPSMVMWLGVALQLACSEQVFAQSLPIEVALQAPRFAAYAPIQPSPDGKSVAYTLLDPRRASTEEASRNDYYFLSTGASRPFGNGGDVWITDVATGATRNVSGGKGNSWYPTWSPDGEDLAFYSDRDGAARLWLWNRTSGELRRLSSAIVHAYGMQWPQWSPDGRQILVPTIPRGMQLADAKNVHVGRSPTNMGLSASVETYRSRATVNPDLNIRTPDSGRHPADLAVVQVETGEARYLGLSHEVGGRVDWFRFSPDGRRMAFSTSARTSVKEARSDLWVAELEHLESRLLRKDVPTPPVSISWVPNGEALAYEISDDGSSGCFRVSLEGREQPLLASTKQVRCTTLLWGEEGVAYFLSGNKVHRVALHEEAVTMMAEVPGRTILDIVADANTHQVYRIGDGNELIVQTRDERTLREGYFRINPTSGKARALIESDSCYSAARSSRYIVRGRGKPLFVQVEGATHPQEIWSVDAGNGNLRQITRVNRELGAFKFAGSRLIAWKSRRGENLRGALLLPLNYAQGRKYPLVVVPYGGDFRSRTLNVFGGLGPGAANLQLLATRGYAVLLPDVPTRSGTPTKDIADAVVPAVDRVIELGIADPARVGVQGHSFGGYNVLSLIVQTTRFRAAIAEAGYGNLISSYLEMLDDGTATNLELLESSDDQGSIGRNLWQARQRYIDESPLFWLDRASTPVLLIHGTADARVPVARSDEIFVALRRLGKEVEYARYEGEEHVPSFWRYANQLDYVHRVLAWLDCHLRDFSTCAAVTSAE